MRSITAAAWSILTVLAPVVPAQDNPTTRLQREQNEILRKTERLEELMSRLKARYERDGRTEQVRLLESGLQHLEKSRLLRAASAVPGSLDNGAYDDAVRDQATVIEELERLLDILLDRQSIENLDEEIEATEEMIERVDQLITRQNELQEDARSAREQTATETERALQQALETLAREQRTEAAENTHQAGTRMPILESAIARLQGLLRSQEALEEGAERQLQGAPDETRASAFELGAIEEAQRELMAGRGRQRELERLAELARQLDEAARGDDDDRIRDAHDRLRARLEDAAGDAQLDEGVRRELAGELEQLEAVAPSAANDEARAALRDAARDTTERAERAAAAARDATDRAQAELRERTGRAAQETAERTEDAAPKPTPASRALDRAAEAMDQATARSREGDSTEALAATSAALRKLAEARQRFREANPTPSARARDMASTADQVARDLRGTPRAGESEQQAAEQLDEAEQALRAAGEQLGRDELGEQKADPSETHDRLGASRGALERALESLQQQFEAATAEREGALRAAAARQAELAERAAGVQDELDAARARGDLSQEQRDAAESAMQRAREAMQRAQGELQSGRQSSAAGQQSRAADELEKAAEGIERNRPLTEEERAAMQRVAEEQKQLEEDIIRLAKLAEERKNRRAAEALQRASQSSSRAARALDEGDPQEADQQQDETREQLERAQEELESERDRYLDLRQEELLFRIGEELKQFLEVQRELTKETETAGAGLDESGRLSRPTRRKLNQVGERELELVARTEFILQALVEEGVLVFTHALSANVDDLKEVSDRLAGRNPDPGSYTVMLQRDVEDRAEKLVEALKREQQRRQQEGQQQQQRQNQFGNQKQPLVPLLAELKMLRQMEEDMRVRTQQVERLIQAAGADGVTEFDLAMAERLAHQHGALTAIFKQIKAALEQQMQQAQQDPLGGDENKERGR